MRYTAPPDCTEICSSRFDCAGRTSSRRTVLGDDGKCSSCHAAKALSWLEARLSDEGSVGDVIWEALSRRPDDLAATIERLWDARVCEAEEKAAEKAFDAAPHARRCACEKCRGERDYQGDLEYDRRRDDELTEKARS